jgi:hypothetical protein
MVFNQYLVHEVNGIVVRSKHNIMGKLKYPHVEVLNLMECPILPIKQCMVTFYNELEQD